MKDAAPTSHSTMPNEPEILDIIDLLGFEVHTTGTYCYILCPFHDDKNPSLCVYPQTNSWFCYGCSSGGDVYNFLAKHYNKSYKEIRELFNSGSMNFELNKLISSYGKLKRSSTDINNRLIKLSILFNNAIKLNKINPEEYISRIVTIYDEMSMDQINKLIHSFSNLLK